MEKLKNNLLKITDNIAPIKEITIKQKDYCPWFDNELAELKSQRNFYFNLKNNYDENKIEQKTEAHELYVQMRSAFQKLNRFKMIDYFAKRKINDFKNSKNFWKFYSALNRIKSDKSTNYNEINILDNDDNLLTDTKVVSNKFNSFFTNLSSESLVTNSESHNKIFENFKMLKDENKIKTTQFEFKKVSVNV